MNNDSYTRLMEAASQLRGWTTPAAVARGLTEGGLPAYGQTMYNWKTRGISAEGLLEACRIIGCRCEYVRAGTLPIADVRRADPFGSIAFRAAELLEAMPLEQQREFLHFLQVLAVKNQLLPPSA